MFESLIGRLPDNYYGSSFDHPLFDVLLPRVRRTEGKVLELLSYTLTLTYLLWACFKGVYWTTTIRFRSFLMIFLRSDSIGLVISLFTIQ
jgi:hypothetical protein